MGISNWATTLILCQEQINTMTLAIKECCRVIDIDGLVQEICNPIANALELRLYYTNP